MKDQKFNPRANEFKSTISTIIKNRGVNIFRLFNNIDKFGQIKKIKHNGISREDVVSYYYDDENKLGIITDSDYLESQRDIKLSTIFGDPIVDVRPVRPEPKFKPEIGVKIGVTDFRRFYQNEEIVKITKCTFTTNYGTVFRLTKKGEWSGSYKGSYVCLNETPFSYEEIYKQMRSYDYQMMYS